MPDWGVIDGPTFSLRDVRVARWNGDGSWGAAVRVPSVRITRTRLITINGRLEGDGGITDAHAEAISGEGTLQFGGGNLSLYNTITGYTKTLTGVAPNRVDRIKYTKKAFPFFAICGKANSTDGVGDTHVFLPKVKLMEGFELGYVYGEYSQPELSFVALPDEKYVVSGTNEVQTITVTGTPTGGNFKLTFQGAQTANIAYNAIASAVQSALEALSTIGSGNVLCSGGPLPGTPVTVTFQGTLAAQSLPQMTADSSGLTGGTTPTATVTTATEGVEAEPVIFEQIVHEAAAPVQIPPL
jgi:hypothetical protein